jgi:hypothetical protein
MTKSVASKFEQMAETFRERGAMYGRNYVKLGQAMHALFPEGLTINTPEDWTRLHLFMLGMTKQSRYANNFTKGGHPDSIHDSAVYNTILEAYDEECRAGDQQVEPRNNAKARNAPARKKPNGPPRPSGRRGHTPIG